MKAFFVRHGEYQNPSGVIPYRLPGFPLTELGISQAHEVADILINEKIRSLYTSPIERCVETAEIIGSKLHLHPNKSETIIETGTPLQGMSKGDFIKISKNYPYDIPSHIEGGGESPEAIFERMTNFVDKLKQMSKNSSHVIVSHGDPIQIYLSGTLSKIIPHSDSDFYHGKLRYIPMGGLVLLDYSKSGIPQYKEII